MALKWFFLCPVFVDYQSWGGWGDLGMHPRLVQEQLTPKPRPKMLQEQFTLNCPVHGLMFLPNYVTWFVVCASGVCWGLWYGDLFLLEKVAKAAGEAGGGYSWVSADEAHQAIGSVWSRLSGSYTQSLLSQPWHGIFGAAVHEIAQWAATRAMCERTRSDLRHTGGSLPWLRTPLLLTYVRTLYAPLG